MARKTWDGKLSGTGRGPRSDLEAIFGDKRSGRDRRATEQAPVSESRRAVSDRRKAGRVSKSAWWLERDYVESHHFVQKSSSSSRAHKRDEDGADD